MAIATWSGSLLGWEKELSALKARLAPVFRRKELKATAGAFLDGLLSGVERKTGWLMAEQAGLERPYRMQSLLGRSQWDEDALRDEVRAYVIEAVGDPDGVLIADETGFLKKASIRPALLGNIPARPDESRTAKWACFWPMPAASAKR